MESQVAVVRIRLRLFLSLTLIFYYALSHTTMPCRSCPIVIYVSAANTPFIDDVSSVMGNIEHTLSSPIGCELPLMLRDSWFACVASTRKALPYVVRIRPRQPELHAGICATQGFCCVAYINAGSAHTYLPGGMDK
jgi:hypothetical protein